MTKSSWTLLLATTLCALPSTAQTVVESWANEYYTPLHGYDYGDLVTVDADGNIIVAGQCDRKLRYPQILLLKLSGSGVPMWTNYLDGPSTPIALGTDTANNIFVAGTTSDKVLAFQLTSSGVMVTSNALITNGYGGYSGLYTNGNFVVSQQNAIMKYTAGGSLVWSNTAPPLEHGADFVTDGADNLFVAGFSLNKLDVLAYRSDGVLLWSNNFDGLYGGDYGPAITLDANTNIFVSGYGLDTNFVTLKFTASGSLVWSNDFRPPIGFDRLNATVLCVDQSSGNVYVAGQVLPASRSAVPAFLTLAYSNTGAPLWTNYYSPGTWAGWPQDIGVLPNGTVALVGSYLTTTDRRVMITVGYSGDGTLLWSDQLGDFTAHYEPRKLVIAGEKIVVIGNARNYGRIDLGNRVDCITAAIDSSGAPLWTNIFDSVAVGGDIINAVAVDQNGSVYAAGSSFTETNYDSQLVAYSNDGTLVWSNHFDSPASLPASSEDQLFAMVAAPNGRIYAAGSAYGDSRRRMLALCYWTNGMGSWTNNCASPVDEDNRATCLGVDDLGNVFVGGYVGNSSKPYYGLVAYSSDGVLLWTNRYVGPGNTGGKIEALSVDRDGNVIVTGGGTGTNGTTDFLTIKYSNGGVPLWTNRYDGPANSTDKATGIAVDADGNIFVSGTSLNTNAQDYTVIAYSPEGTPLWTNCCHPSVSYLVGSSALVTCDKSRNVYMAGCLSGGSKSNDIVIKYSHAGLPLWTNIFASSVYPGPGEIRAIAVDDLGTSYVTGYAWATNGLTRDTYTVAYSPAGSQLWAIRAPAPYPFSPYGSGVAVALSPKGEVVVGANHCRTVPGDSYTSQSVIKYSSKPLIVAEPASFNLLSGSVLNLSVGVSGTQPFSYQWYFEGVQVEGATNSFLTISNATDTRQGSYQVVVTNLLGASTSAPALVKIYSDVGSRLDLNEVTSTNVSLSATGVTGMAYSLDVSTNLQDWVSLITNVVPYEFVDTNRNSFSRRFYRLRWEQ